MEESNSNNTSIRKYHLPEEEIAKRLLSGPCTQRSLAKEYGCSPSTISVIGRKHNSKESILAAKIRKQREKLTGRPNPLFKKWRMENCVWSGRKHSQASKEKQAKKRIGTKIPIEQRIATSARMQGITASEWKSFKSKESDRLKRTGEWARWRTAVFQRDNYTCQHCQKRGFALHPHHIKEKSKYPDLIFNVDNGVTLCVPCHRKTPSYGRNNLSSKKANANPWVWVADIENTASKGGA